MEEESSVADAMDREVTVTKVSEGSADFVRIKQEVDLPEDDTYYPMDFGISVDEEEEMNPVYVNIEPGSSGMKRRRKEIISYKEESTEEESEESEEENEEDSDEEWSNDGDEQSEEDGDQEWTDEQDDPADQPSTSESTSAPVTTDAPPVDIKQEPLSDDEGQHLPYQEDPDQFAESYKMLESLRRSCEQEGVGRSSTGGPVDSKSPPPLLDVDGIKQERTEVIICAICGDLFNTQSDFDEHQKVSHFSVSNRHSAVGDERGVELSKETVASDPVSQIVRFEVEEGGYEVLDKTKNFQNAVDPEEGWNLNGSQEMPSNSQCVQSESRTCRFCKKACPNKRMYLLHLRTKHSEELPYECPNCKARYLEKKDLDSYSRTRAGRTDKGGKDRNICEFCGDKTSYLCLTCDREFKSRSKLIAHQKVHSKRRLCYCHLCDEYFPDTRRTREHLETHYPIIDKRQNDKRQSVQAASRIGRKGQVISGTITPYKKKPPPGSGTRVPLPCFEHMQNNQRQNYLPKHFQTYGFTYFARSSDQRPQHPDMSVQSILDTVHRAASQVQTSFPSPSHYCQWCGMDFDNLKELVEHTQMHIKKGKTHCPVCKKYSRSKKLFRKHLRKHGIVLSHESSSRSSCNSQVPMQSRNSMLMSRKKTPPKTYISQRAKLKRSDRLMKKYLSERSYKSRSSSNLGKCPVESQNFDNRQNTQHASSLSVYPQQNNPSRNFKSNKAVDSSQNSILSSPGDEKSYIHSCGGCKCEFESRELLSQHICVPKFKLGIYCHLCPKWFESKLSLQWHMSLKHPQANEIHVEESVSTKDQRSVAHPLIREVCSKSSAPQSGRMTHWKGHSMNTQSKVQPQSCNTVPQEGRMSGRKRKNPFNDQEEKLRCAWCQKEFHSLREQLDHINIHLAWGNNRCPICGKWYALQPLRAHLRVAHAIVTPSRGRIFAFSPMAPLLGGLQNCCSWCDEEFDSRSALDIHTQLHISKESNRCPLCGMWFKNPQSQGFFRLHLRNHGIPVSMTSDDGRLTNDSSRKDTYSSSVSQTIDKFKQIDHTSSERQKKSVESEYADEEEKLCCAWCFKQFHDTNELLEHTNTHIAYGNNCCPVCKKWYGLASIKRHLKLNHGINTACHAREFDASPRITLPQEMQNRCKWCDEQFESSKALGIHSLLHICDGKNRCPVCGKWFGRVKRDFKVHLRCHGVFIPRDYKVLKVDDADNVVLPSQMGGFKLKTMHLPNIQNEGASYKLCCAWCKKQFNEEDELVSHTNIHFAHGNNCCPICKTWYRHLPYMKHHLKVSHGINTPDKDRNFDVSPAVDPGQEIRNRCRWCDEEFKSSDALASHTLLHIGRGKNRCPVCGEWFRPSAKQSFKVHLRSHGIILPCTTYAQNVDGSNMVLPASEIVVVDKMEVHSPNILNQDTTCVWCSKHFHNTDKLLDHIKIHIAIGNNCCPVCKKWFTFEYFKGHLKLHGINTPVHGRKFDVRAADTDQEMQNHCRWCYEEFDSVESLGIHSRLHISKGSNRCPVCGKWFRSDQRLEFQLHLRKHGINIPSEEGIPIEDTSSEGASFKILQSPNDRVEMTLGITAEIPPSDMTHEQLPNTDDHAKECSPSQNSKQDQDYHVDSDQKLPSSQERLTFVKYSDLGEGRSQCCSCGTKFNESQELLDHVEDHSYAQRKFCPICVKLLSREKPTSNSHLQMHGIIRPQTMSNDKVVIDDIGRPPVSADKENLEIYQTVMQVDESCYQTELVSNDGLDMIKCTPAGNLCAELTWENLQNTERSLMEFDTSGTSDEVQQEDCNPQTKVPPSCETENLSLDPYGIELVEDVIGSPTLQDLENLESDQTVVQKEGTSYEMDLPSNDGHKNATENLPGDLTCEHLQNAERSLKACDTSGTSDQVQQQDRIQQPKVHPSGDPQNQSVRPYSMKVADKESKWQCSLCQKKFHEAVEVVYHVKVHADGDVKRCPICAETLILQKYAFTSHFIKHGILITQSPMSQDMNKEMNKTMVKNKGTIAKRPCSNIPQKNSHEMGKSLEENSSSQTSDHVQDDTVLEAVHTSSLDVQSVKKEKTWQCCFCKIDFHDPMEVVEHSNEHVKGKVKRCPICSQFISRKPFAINKHFRKHRIKIPSNSDNAIVGNTGNDSLVSQDVANKQTEHTSGIE
ncbi:uncharacterized protein LOC121427583 isoform X2 [Lytechinus variegatus]|uniref:uncharacterized protein LOC121427583 isoform X2 n=1 Tax=Lytechinus variegatus TaxID=7654 RepID=UPI001BB20673|nr:uncharacterized protein LOC121427583 isoform X2 [Lytechinus variegatus]